MRIRKRPDDSIEILAPAKLNLFLEVVGKTDDGYHRLETVICKVGLYDTVQFRSVPGGKITLQLAHAGPNHDPVPANQDNLLVKAIRQLQVEHGVEMGAELHLIKRIPSQAGLGGGSADAAAGLVAANMGWKLGLSPQVLSAAAADIGSDVPFFLHSSPAICRGRGEQVTSFGAERFPRHFVILQPNEGLSTRDVFARLAGVPQSPRSLPVTIHPHGLFNRLQQPAGDLSGMMRDVVESLQEVGLPHHLMTGSGSAFFAICKSRREALRASYRLRQRGWDRVFVADSILEK